MSEPRPITVTRWVCPYCNRGRAHKTATITHMARCWRNPEARSCFTCTHFNSGEDHPDHNFTRHESCSKGIDLQEAGLPVGCPTWKAKPGRN